MTAGIDRKTLAVLLRRAGLPVTKARIDDLIGPVRYVEAAGRRLSNPETAKLSPVAALWKQRP
jgi:hypothetical protein